MKKIALLFVLVVNMIGIHARPIKDARIVIPQKITGINVEPHDSAWYAEQSMAWLEKAKQNPQDELAWKYYFMATSYLAKWSDGDDTNVDVAMSLIEDNIKDTYTYNYCKYRYLRNKADVSSEIANGYIRNAMKMLPLEKDFFDYDVLTFFCATHKDCPLLSKISREYYDSGLCSPYALNYSRNELRCIPSNAIYVGTTDVDLIPKWVLINGNGEYSGVYCIVRDMLLDSVYLDKVCDDLCVKEKFTKPEYCNDFYQITSASSMVLDSIMKFLQDKTGRPMFFSSLNYTPDEPWTAFLYDEGLVYRYTTGDYSDDSVYINNLEHVYDLKSMVKPAKDDIWNASNHLAAQYILALNTVLYTYAEQKDKKKAKWSYDIVKEIVKGMNLTKEEKREVREESDLLYKCAMEGGDPESLYEEEE